MTLQGGISGLSLSQSPLDELCVLYAATLQALALGTRHIIEEMNKVCHDGHNLISRLVIASAPF
jgi:ribulose kinase